MNGRTRERSLTSVMLMVVVLRLLIRAILLSMNGRTQERSLTSVMLMVVVLRLLNYSILQLMNVEGMTRENVASHLQKYRLYLKRLAGIPPSAPLPLRDRHNPATRRYPG